MQENSCLVASATATAQEVCMTVLERGLLSDKATGWSRMDDGPIILLPTSAVPVERGKNECAAQNVIDR